MPTATLTFNLPEEQEEFEDAQQGGNWHALVEELDNWLRNEIKHGRTPTSRNLDRARERLYDLMNARGLSLFQ